MDNLMVSIENYIGENFTAFGLDLSTDLKMADKTITTIPDGGRWLVLLPLKTLPDKTRGITFGNLLNPGQKGERFLTLARFECRTRAASPGLDFLWNTARQFRDKTYNALAGQSRCGLTIPRYDWTDPENPFAAGEIYFEVNPAVETPVEEIFQDPEDQCNKSIYLTYSVHWWRPVS